MNRLDQIENRIKEIIEKGSDLLPWTDQGAVLVSHFCETLRRFLLENPGCLQDSPPELRIFMSAKEAGLWKQQPDWEKMLLDAFTETVIEMNCKPDLMPELTLLARNSLQNGIIAYACEESPSNHEKTGAVSLSRSSKTFKPKVKAESGLVLFNLEKTIPVDRSVLNLGRRGTNEVVINDLRVSRVHAQLRKTRDGYMVFDVGSTGGTFVNGERITSRLLQSGDVISLAGYTLVFTNEKDHSPELDREITSELSKHTNLDKS